MSVTSIRDYIYEKAKNIEDKVLKTPSHADDIVTSNMKTLNRERDILEFRCLKGLKLARKYKENMDLINEAISELEEMKDPPQNIIALIEEFTDYTEAIKRLALQTAPFFEDAV